MSSRYRFSGSPRHMLIVPLFAWMLMWSHALPAAASDIRIAAGPGSFSFVDEKGDRSKRITVYTYLPKELKADTAPIVFVMHGQGGNASGYRDTWIEQADKYGFMVVAPLFDSKQWRGGGYSYASVVGRDGRLQDASLWSYSVIEHLFDAIKEATGNQRDQYFLYGHSEGGQFVHRLVLLLPDARYARAVAANPGWYTVPNFDIRFPYGLGGTAASAESLKKSLGREFVLLLGDRDTDPNHPQLRRTAQAMAQGAHRFERGQHFYAEAERRAAERAIAFAWQLRIVRGAAHQNSRMSAPAAEVLMHR